jgi:hypothetical protein
MVATAIRDDRDHRHQDAANATDEVKVLPPLVLGITDFNVTQPTSLHHV